MPSSPTARSFPASAIIALVSLCVAQPSASAEPPDDGIQQRTPWTGSRITGSPDPPRPYVTQRAYPSLTFTRCLDMAPMPGSDRLFVVEQHGKIFSFPRRPDIEQADLVVDLAKEIEGVRETYAIAFHPDFERNRYCYVCYIKAPKLDDGTHVARFRVTDTDPPTFDMQSETTLVTWLSGGHNGCCLKFGPDGYLYISTGDGGPANPPDPLRAGQDLSNLLSAILRIDVDQTEGDKNYRIPPDNPFVDFEGARGEIWAYGLRNPWRMSFDRKTGDLWVGDVGWELWELLYRIEPGGNYGWSIVEGRQPTNPEWPRGPTPILPPTIDHPHSESSSITDGLTYYGDRLQELQGTHLYGDYDTGKIWGFRYEDGQVVDHRELADTTHRIVGFGEDHDGEFYLLDHTAGTIHQLVPNPNQDRESTFPRKLSESGLFSTTAELMPAPGVVPYSINAQPWEDHAVAERLVAVPNDLSIAIQPRAWEFPPDSVLVKTLSLDLEHGDPSTRRRIETQILHFDGRDWQPYTYRWNDAQTDAVLVEAIGAEQTFDVVDADAPGGKRKQTWRYFGRAECKRCHNKWSGPPLAFNTPQLNKEHAYAHATASQLDVLAQIGLFDKPIASEQRPRLTDPRDTSADVNARARAYLHTNCAHCHRLHAGSAVLSKMNYDLPLEKTDMLGARPSQGTFGIFAAQVITPGDPFRSVLLYRMAKLGNGRMPHLGATEIDRDGLDLMYEWLRQIPPDTTGDATEDAAADEAAAKRRQEEIAHLDRLKAADEPAQQAELIDQLLSSTSGGMLLLWSIDDGSLPDTTAALAVERAAQHAETGIRDLFERFLPPDRRIKRLGSVVQPDQILSLPGDAARGREIFFATAGVQCKNCHRIRREGVDLGPDLTTIGKKLNREQLLESILEPSKSIDPKYVTYLVETTEGRVFSGLLVKKDEQAVVLKDAQNKEIRIPADRVEQLVPQQQSLMPELLHRDLTAQQLSDLLEYLGSLK